tara:strand:- start:603 stop:791 length:189 start_codon:yes stop_codon:yes gene_type:complete
MMINNFVASPNFDLRIKDLNDNQLVQLACEVALKLDQCNVELESRIPSKVAAKAAVAALEVG